MVMPPLTMAAMRPQYSDVDVSVTFATMVGRSVGLSDPDKSAEIRWWLLGGIPSVVDVSMRMVVVAVVVLSVAMFLMLCRWQRTREMDTHGRRPHAQKIYTRARALSVARLFYL